MAEFEWTNVREEAAQLVSLGELSIGEIAAKVGVTDRTLYEWRKNPEFTARVDGLIEDIRAALRRRAISLVERRIDSLNTRWMKLHRVIEARSTDPDCLKAAGGDTGLLVHNVKSVGVGPAALIVDEYTVDTGLLNELRQIEKQAAIELRQWTEKADITSNGQTVAVQVYLPSNGRDNPTEQPGAGDIPGEPG